MGQRRIFRNQHFGVELEFMGIARHEVARVLKENYKMDFKIRNDNECEYEYKDNMGRVWILGFDSSIKTGEGYERDCNYQIEVKTPILSCEELKKVKEIVKILAEHGAKVNMSCGFHVHVSSSKYRTEHYKELQKEFFAKQSMIYHAFGVYPQREFYCNKLSPKFIYELEKQNPDTIDELAAHYYNKKLFWGIQSAARDRGINLSNIFDCKPEARHIEYRMLNGTLDYEKVGAYIEFCMALTYHILHKKTLKSPNINRVKKHKYKFISNLTQNLKPLFRGFQLYRHDIKNNILQKIFGFSKTEMGEWLDSMGLPPATINILTKNLIGSKYKCKSYNPNKSSETPQVEFSF